MSKRNATPAPVLYTGPTPRAPRNAQQPSNDQAQRRTRTTRVDVVIPTTFKALSQMTGVPAVTIGKRYHEAKAQHPRKPVTLDTLTTYARRSKYNQPG